MRRGLVRRAALAIAATPAAAQDLMLPSGVSATLYDVVPEGSAELLAPDAFTDPEAAQDSEIPEDIALDVEPDSLGTEVADVAAGGLARFRLSVPGLAADDAGYETVAGDFLWLCENLALPALSANGWQPVEGRDRAVGPGGRIRRDRPGVRAVLRRVPYCGRRLRPAGLLMERHDLGKT